MLQSSSKLPHHRSNHNNNTNNNANNHNNTNNSPNKSRNGANTLNAYQSNLLLKLFDENDKNLLLVMAKGLGIEIIITHTLRMFCDPSQLVFIINAKPYEEELIKQLLLESGLIKIENLPKSITSNFSINERVELYNQGGCLFITSRILIVDLLNEKVPIPHVSGLVVLNAHEVTEKSTEAFILRVFRLSNPINAFVKGFTECAEELTRGFSKLEQVMRLLFVDKVEFKPRFDLEVSQTLTRYQPIVKEIIVPMTHKMKLIENGIIDIITTALDSLKKNNPSLDLSEIKIEDCYFKSFHKIILHQLKPIWNRIGHQSRKHIEDLKVMRGLLFYLLNYDCVTFYDYLETLRLSDGKTGIPSSTWLTTDTASDIYQHAKDRIYTLSSSQVKSPKKQKTLTQMERQDTLYVSVDSLEFNLEENPKWKHLEKTIEKIYDIIQTTNNPNINGRVLILASNEKSCSQVRTYLELGGKTLLNRLIHRLIGPQIRKQQRKIDKQKEEVLGTKTKTKTKTKKKGVKRKSLQNNELDLLSQHVSNFQENQEELEKSKLEESILVYEVDSDDDHDGSGGGGDIIDDATNSEMEDFIDPPTPPPTPQEQRNSTTEMEDLLVTDDGGGDDDNTNGKKLNQKKHPIDEFFQIISDKISDSKPKEMQVIIHSLYDTSTILDDLMPSFVVLYENDLAFVRKIEHYQCKYPYIPLHVYLLSHDRNSVEYKQYQATVEREKEAFKKLIVSYGSLTVPTIDTLISDIHLRERVIQSESVKLVPKAYTDTRRAGGNMAVNNSQSSNCLINEFNFALQGSAIGTNSSGNNEKKSKIVIDAREFRSTLPSLLNSSGYRVLPIQISVGDYIVSKHCCVERKSTIDLWQSLNCGRLFQQSEKMIKYYKHAVLLIQFEQDEAFALPDPYSGFYSFEDGKIEEKSIMTKLVLTAIHFPKLKIAYSRTPAATAKFFYMMKHQVLQYNDYDMEENEEDYEPDVSLAQAIGTSEHVEENESSNQAIDFLSRLPGVTAENMPRIINSVTNLYELADLSVHDLTEIMKSEENAKKLYEFMRESIDME